MVQGTLYVNYVTKFVAIYVDDKKNYKAILDKAKLNLATNYRLDNCYFAVGDSIFRHVTETPMGSDPASSMTNFSLIYFKTNRSWS